jgi:hypothetical protein
MSEQASLYASHNLMLLNLYRVLSLWGLILW